MLILERVGPAIAGDPYRIDKGARVCVELVELVGASVVEVGVVDYGEELTSSYSTSVPASVFASREGWKLCHRMT